MQILLISLFIKVLINTCLSAQDHAYFGQEPPGSTPILFAPEVFTGDPELHSTPVFSNDLNEIYWTPLGADLPGIMYMKYVNGIWTDPQPLSFETVSFKTIDASLSPSNDRMFFISSRPNGGYDTQDLWYANRIDEGWSEPEYFNTNVNALKLHWKTSMANNGNLYFGAKETEIYNIYVSTYINEEYSEPVILNSTISTNTDEYNPFVATDESYLIFHRVEANGYGDLYISFRNTNGSWSNAVNMGNSVNTDSYHEISPYVSPDGEYLFFLSTRDGLSRVYWVDAQVIYNLITRVGDDKMVKTTLTFKLFQNYPNPFNPVTKIRYELPQSTDVILKIYGITGNEIETLINEYQSKGLHSITWDGTDRYGNTVSSGVYIYRLKSGNMCLNKKMLIIK